MTHSTIIVIEAKTRATYFELKWDLARLANEMAIITREMTEALTYCTAFIGDTEYEPGTGAAN